MLELRERSPLRVGALLLTLGLVPACAGTVATVGAPFDDPEPTVPDEPDFADIPAELRTEAALQAVLAGDGQAVFRSVCAQCHSVTPPADQAPPMAMVVRRYRNVHESVDAVRDAMIRWLDRPEAERSALPDHALEQYGLMPAQALSEDQAEQVVEYVLALDDGRGGPPGGGPGMAPWPGPRSDNGARGCSTAAGWKAESVPE